MLHGGCHARLETLTWAGAAAPWQRPGQRGSEPGGARITHVLRVHVLDYTRAMCVVVNSGNAQILWGIGHFSHSFCEHHS